MRVYSLINLFDPWRQRGPYNTGHTNTQHNNKTCMCC